MGGAGSPSNTIPPGPRPTSIPSGISINPAVWPQQTRAENWGEPLGGPHLTQCRLGRGLPPYQMASWPHCARWEPSSPKGATPTQFSAHVCCGQTAGWIKVPLGMEVALGPGDRWALCPLPDQKGAQRPPQFSARLYCGRTAGWIKMPRGTDVGRPHRVSLLPLFSLCLLWPNG